MDLYNLPILTFVVDGYNYEILPEEYIMTATSDGVEDPYEHSDLNDVI